MRELSACPVCGGDRHEPVAEYNGLIAHDKMRKTELCRYDYRLCHSCGAIFASRRPTGSEYTLLYSHFNEMLGRDGREGPLHQDGPVTPELEKQFQANPAWWRLSETGGELTAAMRKQVRWQVAHLAPLVAHCKIEGARILELRTSTGFISSFLKQVLGARDACVMTTFPIQQEVIERLHGLTCATGALDEKYEIPFDGPFDIVIAPHVFVHAPEPLRLFEEIRRVLAPRGWVYLCEEPDDVGLFRRGKNLFSELKCFHFQQVDEAAYARVLQLHGFRVAITGRKEPGRPSTEMFALGRMSQEAAFEPLSERDLAERRTMYQRWRDESILAFPEHMQAVFVDELPEITKRALSCGYAEEIAGQIRPTRKIYMVHAEGYARQNAAASMEPHAMELG